MTGKTVDDIFTTELLLSTYTSVFGFNVCVVISFVEYAAGSMVVEALRGKVGAPVTGRDEFFDREKELAELIEKIERGESVYISAPRRVGKTSLMHKAEEELISRGHTCLFFDLEGYTSPSDWISVWFLDVILDKEAKLTTKVSMAFKNMFKEMGTSDSAKEGVLKGLFDTSNWRERGNNIFSALANNIEEDKRLVIFLDELAVMIEHFRDPKIEADIFLSWLRGIQQKHHNKLSFVVASSIGLPPLLNKLGLSRFMNVFSDFTLDAWEHDIAVRCINALARNEGIEISDDVARCMVEHIGWCSPYYVQLFFDVLKDECRDKTCTCKDAIRIYQEKLVRGQKGNYQLNHMEERLRYTFSEQEYTLAMWVLSRLSGADDATTEKELIERANSEKYGVVPFRQVIQVLEHDGYIKNLENGWVFQSGLLKDWWRHRYGDNI